MEIKQHKLSDFTRGWLIGDIDPALFKRNNIEIAVQQWKEGDLHEAHFHKETDEYNVILYGACVFDFLGKRDNITAFKGDIIVIEKGTAIVFECVEDCAVLVIRDASIKNDKVTIKESI